MSRPGTNITKEGKFRPPELIASLAFSQAITREERCEREGQLYIMAEILIALHRQAEALEQVRDWLDEIHSELRTHNPDLKKGG
jgi:hypothetical protein